MENKKQDTITFYNYRLTTGLESVRIGEGVGEPKVVACLNPHSFVTALDDKLFRTALENSDILLPDGIGICNTLRRYKHIDVDKIAGDDLHRHMLNQLGERGGKVFYMGSNETTLKKIAERIGREYSNIAVATYSPSYSDELPEAESKEIIARIGEFGADVVFVSMTAPKQEKWVERYRTQMVGPQYIASIGAVFDFYAETTKRAPRWMIDMKLEWVVRFMKEPRRMWQRVFVSIPRYLRWTRNNRKEV